MSKVLDDEEMHAFLLTEEKIKESSAKQGLKRLGLEKTNNNRFTQRRYITKSC